MKLIDQTYQTAVDKEAERILKLSVEDFLAIDDYGSIDGMINGDKTTIAYWHHKLDNNIHHVVFQADRKVFVFVNKKYLSGVKLDNNKISKLSDTELSVYD